MKIRPIRLGKIYDVRGLADARKAVAALQHSPLLSVDTETTGIADPLAERVRWCGFFDGHAYAAVPIEWLGPFEEILSGPTSEGPRELVFHNAKYDSHLLLNHGFDVMGGGNTVFDTIVLKWILDPDSKVRDLKGLARTELGLRLKDFMAEMGPAKKGDKRLPIDRAVRGKVVRYMGKDCFATLELFKLYREHLQDIRYGEVSAWEYLCRWEVPFTKLLFEMERRGIGLDKEAIDDKIIQATAAVEEAQRELIRIAGRTDYNPNGRDDQRWLFHEKLKLPVARRTDKGAISINDEVLEAWGKDGVRAAQLTQQFRSLRTKTINTYLTPLSRGADAYGRAHSGFRQDGTGTGRISSAGNAKSTNLLNIPRVARKDPYTIREVFIASRARGLRTLQYPNSQYVAVEDCDLLVLDYKQLEVVIAAERSGEPAMVEAVKLGKDMHCLSGSRLSGHSYDDLFAVKSKDDEGGLLTKAEEVLLDHRDTGKKILFTTLYGGGKKRVAQVTGKSEDESQFVIDQFFDGFPRLKQTIDDYGLMAYEKGYVVTVFGRRRYLPDARSYDKMKRSRAMRQAFNCLPLSTEALTMRGWVSGADIRKDDVLLTKNAETGALEWQQALGIKRFNNYDGELVRFKTNTFSSVSTPNHRWLTTAKRTGASVCRLTDQIGEHGDWRIHRTGTYLGPDVGRGTTTTEISAAQVQLAGWVLTDGHMWGTSRAYVCQSERANPEKVADIDQMFAELGIYANRRTTEATQVTYWEFGRRLGKWLHATFPGRVLTTAFLATLSPEHLELLFQTMVRGDGSLSKGGAQSFYARSPEVAGMFQVLCTMTGRASNCRKRDMSKYRPTSQLMPNIPIGTEHWVVAVLRRTTAQVLKGRTERFVDPQPIWCPVVPNTYFVARHEGHVFITGNTTVQGSGADIVKAAMLAIRDDPELWGLCWMLLQVYDEIAFDVLKSALHDFVLDRISQHMILPAGLEFNLPLRVSGGYAPNWKEAK